MSECDLLVISVNAVEIGAQIVTHYARTSNGSAEVEASRRDVQMRRLTGEDSGSRRITGEQQVSESFRTVQFGEVLLSSLDVKLTVSEEG